MTRMEDIIYDFLESDRIWPPGIVSTKFEKALIEVLKRLTDDVYDIVSERVLFVIEDPRIAAVNVPFKRIFPNCTNKIELRFDTIVVFHQALAYSNTALVGLLAHELAHSFVRGRDYKTDEEETDKMVISWGFAKEHKALMSEQKKEEDK
ncbi:hypothetical protein ACFL7D_09740 [candidate division KSB1 bacterium]